jgi:tetratricopeptide (TPR) repeat protein
VESAKSKLEALKSIVYELNPFMTYVTTAWGGRLRAEIMIAEGLPEGAIEILESLEPGVAPTMEVDYVGPYNLPMIRDTLARAYLAKGDIDGAIAFYEKRILPYPQSGELRLVPPKYYYLLGQLYEKRRDNAKAIQQYERFLELWKDADPSIHELKDAKERLSALKGR